MCSDPMSTVAEFYGRWASVYDRIATAPGVARWRRVAAERVAQPGDTVVEMGCGTGVNLPYLRERVGADGRVVGVDITEPLLERARDRVAGYDNVSAVQADATRPPIRDADAVLATFVCGMFEDPARVVDGWCDLVGSGGRIALMDATATERTVGQPLNPLFRAFVAAGAPTARKSDVIRAPLPWSDVDGSLTRRVTASRTALVNRTHSRRYDEFALGFVGLLSGEVR